MADGGDYHKMPCLGSAYVLEYTARNGWPLQGGSGDCS